MDSKDVLLKLIRIALGNEDDFSLPNVVNWSEVVQLSYQQNVAAIATDGLQKIYDSVSNFDLDLDKPELEGLKYEWLGSSLHEESRYDSHNSLLIEIVSLLGKLKINFVLLKGLGLGHYYPIASHRPCGDIDIFPYGDYDSVNTLFEQNGAKVNTSFHKHSVILFHGITIENHFKYLDSNQTLVEKRVEYYLENLEGDKCETNGYYTPSPLKNYFFLLCHMSRHFSEYESITLRHLLDWGLFLKYEIPNINISVVRRKLKDFRLEKTNDLFVMMAQCVTGSELSQYVIKGMPHDEVDDVLNYVLKNKPRRVVPKHFLSRINYKLHLLLGNYWKYKYLAMTMWERIAFSIKEHLFGNAKI